MYSSVILVRIEGNINWSESFDIIEKEKVIYYEYLFYSGYKYADGKEKQSLLCKGGTEGYEDADTNKRSATIKQVRMI